MTLDNIKSLISDAEELNGRLLMANEDGKIIVLDDDSSKTFLDEGREMLCSIRTNVNYAASKDYPFSVTEIECDSIKMGTIDLTFESLMKYLAKHGKSIDEFSEFVSSTTQRATSGPNNYLIKKVETVDEDGNTVMVEKLHKGEGFTPSLTLG